MPQRNDPEPDDLGAHHEIAAAQASETATRIDNAILQLQRLNDQTIVAVARWAALHKANLDRAARNRKANTCPVTRLLPPTNT